MADRNKLETVEEIKRFALGGNATLTLANTEKNTHVTLWLQRGKRKGAPIFAKVFTGRDNAKSRSYSYVGCVWENDRSGRPQEPAFRHGGLKARLDRDDARVKTVAWLLEVINGGRGLGPVEVWHEGRCCFCHKELTQTESVKRGYGPNCASQRGLPYGGQTKRAGGNGEVAFRREDLEVPCPHCGAGKGERCRSPKGVERNALHRRRVKAIRDERAAEERRREYSRKMLKRSEERLAQRLREERGEPNSCAYCSSPATTVYEEDRGSWGIASIPTCEEHKGGPEKDAPADPEPKTTRTAEVIDSEGRAYEFDNDEEEE